VLSKNYHLLPWRTATPGKAAENREPQPYNKSGENILYWREAIGNEKEDRLYMSQGAVGTYVRSVDCRYGPYAYNAGTGECSTA